MLFTTGDHNRLASDGVHTYVYDNEGNRTLRYVDEDESGTLTEGVLVHRPLTTDQTDHDFPRNRGEKEH